MRVTYFKFEADQRGRTILKGLSPEETMEFEELQNQCDDLRSLPDQHRLDELCEKCRVARAGVV